MFLGQFNTRFSIRNELIFIDFRILGIIYRMFESFTDVRILQKRDIIGGLLFYHIFCKICIMSSQII